MKKLLLAIFLLCISFKPARAVTNCNAVNFAITSPTPYQTFQRLPNKADIPVTGYVNTPGGSFVASYQDAATTLTNITYDNTYFSGTIPNQPQGQGKLTITWSKDGCTKSVSIDYVGIGDIFLMAGQSNSTSVGMNRHTYTHPTLKATLFGNDYKWQELKDPVDGASGQIDTVSSDPSIGGTYVVFLATKIMALTKVPVALIPSAKGGSPIKDWQRNENAHFDRTTLYGSSSYRAKLQRNIRAILWLQGETDIGSYTPQAEYTKRLNDLANNFAQDLGPNIPLVAYQVGTVRDLGPNERMRIVQAIRDAAAANNKIILGPDLGDIDLSSPPSALKIHFVTDAQQQAVADRAFAVLRATLYVNDPIASPSFKPGDFTHDGIINILDYNLLVSKFKNPYTILDYNLLVANFGK